VFDFLNSKSGPLPLNRALADPDSPELAEPDPEAVRLAKYVAQYRGEGCSMFDKCPFEGFYIATRSCGGYFGGQEYVVRDGVRLTVEEAREIREGDQFTSEDEELPPTARCLLTYLVGVPVLFTIKTGVELWPLWDICCAVADQYAKVYEHAARYGVWGHDIDDIVIENLRYFPKERLIHPSIGS
jgi:hypothetical protein